MRLTGRCTAAIMLCLLTMAAAFVLLRSPYGYAAQDREHVSAAGSPEHRTGTDDLGRDRTVRTAAALLLGFAGAAAAATLASLLAVGIGLAAAFAQPWAG